MSVHGMEAFGREGLTTSSVEFQTPCNEVDEWTERISGWVLQVINATQPEKDAQ